MTKVAVTLMFAVSLRVFSVCSLAFAQGAPGPPGEKPLEEDRKVAYGAESDLSSGYVWRGLVVSDRPVVSPAACISSHAFPFLAAGPLVLSNTDDGQRPSVTHLVLTPD